MKKNNKKLLFMLIILIVILMTLVFVLKKIKNYDPATKAIREYGYENKGIYRDPEIEKKQEEKKRISYENISILQKLYGETPVSTVVDKVRKTIIDNISVIMKETNNMSNEELTNYFHNNESKIWKDLSINEETSFINMINNYRILKADPIRDCDSCKFIEKDDGISFVVYYSNGETVECSIKGDNADYVAFEF